MHTSPATLLVALLTASAVASPLCQPTSGLRICHFKLPDHISKWLPGSHSTMPLPTQGLNPYNITEARLAFSEGIAKVPSSGSLGENLGGLPRLPNEGEGPFTGFGNLNAGADPV